MGVGQWTSLLMTHEFRTTPSKLDCALPTLHPKHSNTRGAIISVEPSHANSVSWRHPFTATYAHCQYSSRQPSELVLSPQADSVPLTATHD